MTGSDGATADGDRFGNRADGNRRNRPAPDLPTVPADGATVTGSSGSKQKNRKNIFSKNFTIDFIGLYAYAIAKTHFATRVFIMSIPPVLHFQPLYLLGEIENPP